MRNYEVKKCVELIKNYKFVSALTMQAEIVMLTVIVSVSCTILVLPYLLICVILGFVMGIGKK